jgi:hypothetical protein
MTGITLQWNHHQMSAIHVEEGGCGSFAEESSQRGAAHGETCEQCGGPPKEVYWIEELPDLDLMSDDELMEGLFGRISSFPECPGCNAALGPKRVSDAVAEERMALERLHLH